MKNLQLSIVLILVMIMMSSVHGQSVDADGVGTPVYQSIPAGTVVFFAPTAAEFSEADTEQIQSFMALVQNAMAALEMQRIPSMLVHEIAVTFTNQKGNQISPNLRNGPSRIGAMMMAGNGVFPKSLYGLRTVQEIVDWATAN
jgi:hypothetical protein